MKDSITVIENGQLVLENGILWDGVLVLAGEHIAALGKRSEVEIPTGAYRIDAHGAYVGPGFVDLHTHAIDSYSTQFHAQQAAQRYLANGTTSFLAASEYCMELPTMLEAIACVRRAMPQAKNLRGLYMEGPYINVAYGAGAHHNPWKGGVEPADYTQLVDAAGPDAAVWVIAPEREGIVPFMEYARRVNPATLFAVGHSHATPHQIRALGRALRPTLHTHLMNATGRQNDAPGLRGTGPDEYALQEPEVYAELISDSLGVHVAPDMQRLILHAKGLHRVILITDSTENNFPNPPQYAHVTDLNYDDIGGLSGSRLTMPQACRNLMTHTNCGIAQAFVAAALNPARAMGWEDRGSLEPGKRADLVLVSDRFEVKNVILGGQVCPLD